MSSEQVYLCNPWFISLQAHEIRKVTRLQYQYIVHLNVNVCCLFIVNYGSGFPYTLQVSTEKKLQYASNYKKLMNLQ